MNASISLSLDYQVSIRCIYRILLYCITLCASNLEKISVKLSETKRFFQLVSRKLRGFSCSRLVR